MRYKAGDIVRIIEKDNMSLLDFVKGGIYHLKPDVEEYLNKRDRIEEITKINECHVTFGGEGTIFTFGREWTIFRSLIQSPAKKYIKENYINDRFEILDI